MIQRLDKMSAKNYSKTSGSTGYPSSLNLRRQSLIWSILCPMSIFTSKSLWNTFAPHSWCNWGSARVFLCISRKSCGISSLPSFPLFLNLWREQRVILCWVTGPSQDGVIDIHRIQMWADRHCPPSSMLLMGAGVDWLAIVGAQREVSPFWMRNFCLLPCSNTHHQWPCMLGRWSWSVITNTQVMQPLPTSFLLMQLQYTGIVMRTGFFKTYCVFVMGWRTDLLMCWLKILKQ